MVSPFVWARVILRGVKTHAVAMFVVLAVGVACSKSGDETVQNPQVVAMLDTTAPIYDDGEQQIFQVEKQVALPFRKPEDSEVPKGNVAPYPRPAFHTALNSKTTVRFTITNLDTVAHDLELLIDPWNEFVHYQPGIAQVSDDEVLPNLSGIDRFFVLQPNQRVDGIITPDDMLELAVDLTTAMNLKARPPDPKGDFGGPVLYNRAFNTQNRSTLPDVVLGPWIPTDRATVATVIGFDLGIRTAEKAKLAVEVVPDVEDDSPQGNLVIIDGDEGKQITRPGTALEPPAGTVAD